MDFNSVNAYITNVDENILNNLQVHELYTLRWQIEIMFKIWKSIFKISQAKKVKIERFKCFLYGRLIALLLSSAIAFTSKNIVLVTEGKEISEFQSFGTIFQYFPRLADIIFKENIYILNLFKKIISNFKKFCLKTNKYMKKTPIDILKIIELNLLGVEKIAS